MRQPLIRGIVTLGLMLVLGMLCPIPAQARALQTGIDALNRQDYATAQAQFTIATEDAETAAIAYRYRCATDLMLDDPSTAIADCSHAIRATPEVTSAHLHRGLARYRLAQYAAAIADFSTYLQQHPQSGTAHYNRGLAYVELGQVSWAIADYHQALHYADAALEGGDRADIYNDLGVAYLLSARPEQARTALETAIALNDDAPRAYFNHGCVCHHQGQYPLALADFNHAIALYPAYAEAYLNRALLRHQMGDVAGAIADVHTASQHFAQQGNPAGVQQAQDYLRQWQPRSIAIG